MFVPSDWVISWGMSTSQVAWTDTVKINKTIVFFINNGDKDMWRYRYLSKIIFLTMVLFP